MSDTVISVESLSKCYLVGHRSAGQGYKRYTALRDVLGQKARNIAGNAVNLVRGRQVVLGDPVEEFWALKDVSFNVERGEVLGIIGRNGAGKSTLLKILSRITEPTSGWVTLRGRVASLLEVGTGFHPELTGRENIYLNGAILGMTRAEIHRNFDEIVSFAEVEKFLDTPVKRYSSGMYVRLAFAVAAHLEPEILVVDEILAVGDAEFQEKCLGKMAEVAGGGRTVLFVSHNMAAITQLCQNGIWLDGGQISGMGPISVVSRAYSNDTRGRANSGDFALSNISEDGSIDLISYRVVNALGKPSPPPGTNEDMIIYVTLHVKTNIARPVVGIDFRNERGVLLTTLNTLEQGTVFPALPKGEVTISIRVRRVAFLPGTYTSNFWVVSPEYHVYVRADDCIVFEIARVPVYGTSDVNAYSGWGCVYSDIEFGLEPRADKLQCEGTAMAVKSIFL
jgi:lipopolysaccharide transport system ATP-binding protein